MVADGATGRRRRRAVADGRTRDEAGIRSGEVRTAVLFVTPAFLLYFVFMLYPFLNSIYFSLTSWNGATLVKPFVGLANYAEMLQDEGFLSASWRTMVWIVIGTAAPVAIGLLLALILWTSTPRVALIARTLFFLPFVLPIVVVGLVWGWIYHPLYGVLNSIFQTIGLDSLTRGWLGDPNTALLAVLGAAIWGAFGFVTAVLFAGLQNVNMDLVEAAALDGANWFQRARYVVIPSIAPVVTLVTAITLIGGFAVIDFVLIMTGGGPGSATEVLGYFAYERGFTENRVGYGAAISIFITALTLIAAVAFVRLRERGEDLG